MRFINRYHFCCNVKLKLIHDVFQIYPPLNLVCTKFTMCDERVNTIPLDDPAASAVITPRNPTTPVTNRSGDGQTLPSTLTGSALPVPTASATNTLATSTSPSAAGGDTTPAAAVRLSHEALEQHCRNVEGTSHSTQSTLLHYFRRRHCR